MYKNYVVFIDIDKEKVKAVSEGYDCIGLRYDVTKEENSKRSINETIEKCGRFKKEVESRILLGKIAQPEDISEAVLT